MCAEGKSKDKFRFEFGVVCGYGIMCSCVCDAVDSRAAGTRIIDGCFTFAFGFGFGFSFGFGFGFGFGSGFGFGATSAPAVIYGYRYTLV